MFARTRAGIASIGLNSEQRKALKYLSIKSNSYWRWLDNFKDNVFMEVNMTNQFIAHNYFALFTLYERDIQNRIEQLTEKCRQNGISEWRIRLVS